MASFSPRYWRVKAVAEVTLALSDRALTGAGPNYLMYAVVTCVTIAATLVLCLSLKDLNYCI